ncbi:hypothetical protein BGW80DRAFT_1304054 [Lactifluus volemus]|nr:hypothetical protein BGW80DRAFT_1304054 [Lactifluus volemus]
MDPSYTTNAYTQQTQFQPATLLQFQPDPSQVYQNPISVPSIPPQSRPGPIPSQLQEPSRPHSIVELAERARLSLGDDPRPFKSWLRIAENARREAKGLQDQGDLESAFVEFARAATIVLEKIPAHPDYRVLLTPTQRHNMGLHGQEILDSLTDIRAVITARFDEWRTNPTAARFQTTLAPGSNPRQQPLVARPSIQSRGVDTPSSSSTPSSRTPSPYRQRSREEDRARREREDAMLRDETRRREASSIDDIRFDQLRLTDEDGARRHGEREQEGQRRITEQRQQERDEAEYAAQSARLGQPAGQNQSVTMPQEAVPSIPGLAPATSSGPIARHLQMPLESPTRHNADKNSRVPIQPPITTTSAPPPNFGTVQYPSLMSQHQISQGYHPSLDSMFHRPSHTSHSGLLFQTPEPASHPQPNYYQHPLPKKSQPVHASYATGPSIRRPPLPPKELVAPAPGRVDPIARELKTVIFPRETCGLLLGKDYGRRFVVTTLLIPKQHSTSDTCAMDEEELVMQFTEERSLITLGWVSCHPTSCFMSSVDLHTHSGFQRMLPESFAVVCAPNSTPNYGIFRLTDPPGLKTILDCVLTDAFHPHPELPIYTDADKGHVQMKDLPLEIVDLR